MFLTALSGENYQSNLGSVFQPLRGALFQNETQKVECLIDFVQSVEVFLCFRWQVHRHDNQTESL